MRGVNGNAWFDKAITALLDVGDARCILSEDGRAHRWLSAQCGVDPSDNEGRRLASSCLSSRQARAPLVPPAENGRDPSRDCRETAG
eukprot:9241017-Pyramimonas_sp.AAC.1